MKKYIVIQFGVDLKYNEEKKPIWEGMAWNKNHAIEQAVRDNWIDLKQQEFMKGYMEAQEYILN